CDSDSPLLEHPDLRILSDFQQQQEWVLEPGDMLYLPPRLAHYGIAEDECMTWSVGFRAPSHAAVLTHFTDFLAQYLSNEQRYGDADLSMPADPAQIVDQYDERLQQLVRRLVQDWNAVAPCCARFMSAPRYPEHDQSQGLEPDLLPELLLGAEGRVRNTRARKTWHQEHHQNMMFYVN